jgi:hypothetical protein
VRWITRWPSSLCWAIDVCAGDVRDDAAMAGPVAQFDLVASLVEVPLATGNGGTEWSDNTWMFEPAGRSTESGARPAVVHSGNRSKFMSRKYHVRSNPS